MGYKQLKTGKEKNVKNIADGLIYIITWKTDVYSYYDFYVVSMFDDYEKFCRWNEERKNTYGNSQQ